jgi:hypothetical protein
MRYSNDYHVRLMIFAKTNSIREVLGILCTLSYGDLIVNLLYVKFIIYKQIYDYNSISVISSNNGNC